MKQFSNYYLLSRFVLSLSGLAILPATTISQETDSSRKIFADGWIEQMSNYINLKLALTNTIATFFVETDGADYLLYPNSSSVTRLYVDYRFISFFISFSPSFLPGNDDDDIRGTTSGGGWGFSYNFRQWFNDWGYSRTKGYYVKNTIDFDSTWKAGDPYIQVPDLVTTRFEGLTGYNFNPKFSQSAISSQTERQLKSAGSFIPVFYYRYYVVDNRSGLQKSNNFQVIFSGGYFYTLALRNGIYFSGGLSPGIGYINTRLLIRNPAGYDIEHSNSFVLNLNTRFGAGFNGPSIYGGIYFTGFSSSSRQQNTTAINSESRTTYQLFLGYRFTAPKILRTGYDRTIGRIVK